MGVVGWRGNRSQSYRLIRLSTLTKNAADSALVSRRLGQKASGPQPFVIPAAAKASMADSRPVAPVVGEGIGHGLGQTKALTAIAANSALVRLRSGQNTLAHSLGPPPRRAG